jgi:integrase
LLGAYFTSFRKLSEKARNDRRATLGMWLRWCGRKDYLPEPQLTKLLRSDELKKEQLQPGTISFYQPGELRRVLDAIHDPANGACRNQNRDALLAVTVLQAFGGARLEEALRLRWEDLSQNPDHVEIAGLHAKPRQRRLLVVVPTLALWLSGFRKRSGPIWAAPVNSFVTEWARVRTSAGVPSKRNGLRNAFVSYSYVLRGEVETSVLAGTSPQILHANYRGLATKQESEEWFAVCPHSAEKLFPFPARKTP